MNTISTLRELLKGATKGPWCCTPEKNGSALFLIGPGEKYTGKDIGCVGRDGWGDPFPAYSQEDSALIVAAVNSLPALLDRIEKLEFALLHCSKPCGDTDEEVKRNRGIRDVALESSDETEKKS